MLIIYVDVSSIVINSVSAFPSNADEYADYFFDFTPQADIPLKAQIQLLFPSVNYKEMPTDLKCQLTGAIQTFSSCTISATLIKVNSSSTNYILKIKKTFYVN